MSELRVYEGARKLNVSVDEMIGLLAGKGVDVKSPISVITQEQFDEVLGSYMREPQSLAAKTMEPQSEPEPAAAPVEKEKERARLALVTPISARQALESPQPQTAHETDEDEDEAPAPIEKTEAPAIEQTATSSVKEAPLRAEASGGSTSNLTLAAVGLSIIAIIASIALAVTAVRNAKEVSALNSSVQANQSMLNDTRNALNNLKTRVEINRKLDVRAGLTQRSATLEELSGTMPGPNGEKLRSLASQINALAAGM
jgi:hypothetical protein